MSAGHGGVECFGFRVERVGLTKFIFSAFAFSRYAFLKERDPQRRGEMIAPATMSAGTRSSSNQLRTTVS